MTKIKNTIALAVLLATVNAASADSITAKEIAAGISTSKTELDQEAWWDANMAGKLHDITGKVDNVEKGTFSGYWVTLDIGRGIMVRCGMSSRWNGYVQKIKKGQKYTCKGYVSGTWTSAFGVAFSVDAG
jgi:hypothetical protein